MERVNPNRASRLRALFVGLWMCSALAACAGATAGEDSARTPEELAACEVTNDECQDACVATYSDEFDGEEIMNESWRSECQDFCVDRLNDCVGTEGVSSVKQTLLISGDAPANSSGEQAIDGDVQDEPEEDETDTQLAPGTIGGGLSTAAGGLSAWGCWESTCCEGTGICYDEWGRPYRCCKIRTACERCIWPW